MASIAYCEVRELLNDLNNKLGGEMGNRWQRKLAKMLSESIFPIWQKIQIGLLFSMESCRALLADGGFLVGNHVNPTLNKIRLTGVFTELELVVVSVAELGLSEGVTFYQIVERAQEFSLKLCPDEAGPVLRDVYKDQPRGERLLVAT